MAAEGLPAGGAPPALPGWELDAWYQDLEEVLAAAEPSGPSPPWGAEQGGAGPEGAELDAALAAELLELLEPASTAGTEPAGPAGAPSSKTPPPPLGGLDAEAAAQRGVKRKRCGAGLAHRELGKGPERASEQRVLELTAHNERLREQIRGLSAEVQRTRAALIERIVNLRRA
ncbi:DDIT3 protein, partial [Columbina picui]|nr:DDIT3 protein [Columbina picui]